MTLRTLRALVEPAVERDLPERVRDAIRLQQDRSEILIGWIQLLVVLTFGTLYAVSPKTFDPRIGIEPVPWVLAFYLSFTLLRLVLAHRLRLPAWFLALSVIISLFGVVNTLVLTIYERTREIGMLRAIGASRSQIRRMVRYESLITAMIGAIIGAVIGVAVAVAAVEALSDEGLVLGIPVVGIIVVLVLAGLAGILAGVWPARRASKIEVMEALQYE